MRRAPQERRSGIYLITNTVTGEQYVGQAVDLLRRVQEHWWLLRGGHHNSAMQAAVKQYGPYVFCFEVLEVDIPEDKLNERERYYIQHLNAFYNFAARDYQRPSPEERILPFEELKQRLQSGQMLPAKCFRSLEECRQMTAKYYPYPYHQEGPIREKLLEVGLLKTERKGL